MRNAVGTAILLIGLLGPATLTYGQQAQSCEDQLRAVRVLAEQMARSRSQSEVELSQTVAALLKQIDGLRQEVDTWKAKAPKDGNEPQVGVGK